MMTILELVTRIIVTVLMTIWELVTRIIITIAMTIRELMTRIVVTVAMAILERMTGIVIAIVQRQQVRTHRRESKLVLKFLFEFMLGRFISVELRHTVRLVIEIFLWKTIGVPVHISGACDLGDGAR